MADADWVAERKKSPACPKCGTNDDVVPILYGLPAGPPSDEQLENSVLGGCCVDLDSPTHLCKRCGTRMQREEYVLPRRAARLREWKM